MIKVTRLTAVVASSPEMSRATRAVLTTRPTMSPGTDAGRTSPEAEYVPEELETR